MKGLLLKELATKLESSHIHTDVSLGTCGREGCRQVLHKESEDKHGVKEENKQGEKGVSSGRLG